jgi:hypothetical protein
MGLARLLLLVLVLSAGAVFVPRGTGHAAFHCIRIHAVLGGFNGVNTIQYVELRQVIAFTETQVGGHKIRFHDSSGQLKATFTFPNHVVNAVTGASILIGTQEFNQFSSAGDADFTFTNANTVGANGGDPLHPVQFPGGKVVFADEAGDFNCNGNSALPVDSVAYGGAPPDYGTAFAGTLPNPSDTRALRVGNLIGKPANNSTEYSLEATSNKTVIVPAADRDTDLRTPRNNSGALMLITDQIGGIARPPELEAAPVAGPGSPGANNKVIAIASGGAVALAMLGGAGVFLARRRRVE